MDIRPFKGWRYNTDAQTDISDKVAPPYDILSADDKKRLLAGSERNIVAVDLPHVPPKELGPESEYDQAAERLADWQQDGVLVQEDAPAIYVYDQTYTWAGKTYTRRCILAGVRATPLGEDVMPHEHTFAGPKADRLKLTEKTQTQLSPIFGFYNDPGRQVAVAIEAAQLGEPVATAEIGGVREALWPVTDPAAIERIASALADEKAYIADGHHRYTTAMNYAASLRDAGTIDADHEANFVMFALVASDDPGLVVLPTHRVVAGLDESFTLARLTQEATGFAFQPVDLKGLDLADADAALDAYGQGALLLIGPGGSEAVIGKLTDGDRMVEIAPTEPDAWRNLNVAILHELLLDRALAPWRSEATEVTYTPDGNAARDACQNGQAQLAVCLQGTPPSAVQAIADAGANMPHKSTYFYPKLTTGMVLKPLA
jgi:uncharacterized protein (DUF1015 family)